MTVFWFFEPAAAATELFFAGANPADRKPGGFPQNIVSFSPAYSRHDSGGTMPGSVVIADVNGLASLTWLWHICATSQAQHVPLAFSTER